MKQDDFEPLSECRVQSALRLSDQAGWNQTEDDWLCLMRGGPGSVQVWCEDGEVRASYSVVGYGSGLAWIGMVLVDKAYRGRGLGKSLFEAAMRTAREGGYRTVGLDATDMGEPIYRQRGFETVAPTVRYHGVLLNTSGSGAAHEFRHGLQADLLEFDRRELGYDRAALLRDLNTHGEVLSFSRGSGVAAYAIVRKGRTASHIGPVVAQTPEDFQTIFHGLAARHGGTPVVCDVVSEQAGAILQSHGLQPVRHLKRMTFPYEENCLRGNGIWCATGLEFG